MTKEQIKKKLSIYLDKNDFNIPTFDDMVNFAQQIATESTKELKKENAELQRQRNNCERQFQDKVEEVGIEIEKRLLAEERCKKLEQQIEKMKSGVLSVIKDRMNDDIDQNIIERLAEKWEIEK